MLIIRVYACIMMVKDGWMIVVDFPRFLMLFLHVGVFGILGCIMKLSLTITENSIS